MSIQSTLIAAALTATLAFGAGYYTKGKFEQADMATQAKKVVRQSADSILNSVESSLKIEANIQQSDDNIDQIKKAVAHRLEEKKHGRINGGNVQPRQSGAATAGDANGEGVDLPAADHGCDDRLDNGTVRLLNAARTGGGLESAGLDADQGRATAAVPH